MRTVLLFCLSLLISSEVLGQVYSTQYRAPGQNWMELQTDRFRIIYPERYQAEAERALSILESEYDDIQNLVGGELRDFPVILNPENDRSNGFVSPMNFRSEIEIAPIRGKILNPQTGDWLESVVPHELVHALHFSVNPFSLTRALGLFSPDMRRSVHAAAPLGVLEGIAVEYESHGSIPHSGRGHYPYFNHQFSALVDTPGEWSMGQLFHTSDYTLPFNRHYVGGYEITNWLLDQHGEDAMKKAIRFHYRYPFLGFGTALRHATGQWPRSLYRDFSTDISEREQSRRNKLDHDTDSISEEVPVKGTCRRMNRPLWLDDTTLIFYARFCNRPSGFYLHHTDEQHTEHAYEVILSEDVHYSLSADRSSLFYSRYHTDPFYDNLFRGDLHELETGSFNSRRITHDQRLFSPQTAGERIFALQTEGQHQILTETDPHIESVIRRWETEDDASVIQIAPNPTRHDELALIGRRNGVQGIWFESNEPDEPLFSRSPDIAFHRGSIFDMYWHPDGDRMLFVSDHTGVMNVYEYHTIRESVTQITESLYNAFEASYSPDGSSIAYIRQTGNEQRLYVMEADQQVGYRLPESEWTSGEELIAQLDRPLMNRADHDLYHAEAIEPSEYRTGLSWLKPRLWVPTWERENQQDRIGIALESVDTMSSHAYSFEVNHYRDRFWYDFDYRYKGTYPGFQLNVFNSPSLASFRVESEGEEQSATLLQQSRGASLKIPVPVRFESNARFTSFLIEPQYFLQQTRFLDPAQTSTAFSEFGTRHTVGIRSVFNIRLRQFTRDVQPNSGWTFFTESRYGLNQQELEITTDQFNLTGNLTARKGLRAGVSTYLAPLARWNQSLGITSQVISQTDVPVFNLSSLFSPHFPDFPLGAINHTGLLNTRYTIPLTYPDDGGLLIPAYLSNIYLVLFSQTAADLGQSDIMSASRTVIGGGIRSRFRLSNLAIDIGVSLGWEPSRNEVSWHVGSF